VQLNSTKGTLRVDRDDQDFSITIDW